MKDELLERVVRELVDPDGHGVASRPHCEGNPLPSLQVLGETIDLFRGIVFPGYFGSSVVGRHAMTYRMGFDIGCLYDKLVAQIQAALCVDDAHIDIPKQAETISAQCIEQIPKLRGQLVTDVMAMYDGDPAATSYGEVISCYPAIRAISSYRLAHALYLLGVPLIPRIITEMAHSDTGIDIHPAATIGDYFAIDHGTGVVIGATSIIGNHVRLYQGVTLGARSFPLDVQGNPIKGIDRHPILEDDVVVYSNSTILGRITIGRGAVIGGNVWVTTDVLPGAKVLQR
jgi:serine O-acetyltransferase